MRLGIYSRCGSISVKVPPRYHDTDVKPDTSKSKLIEGDLCAVLLLKQEKDNNSVIDVNCSSGKGWFVEGFF